MKPDHVPPGSAGSLASSGSAESAEPPFDPDWEPVGILALSDELLAFVQAREARAAPVSGDDPVAPASEQASSAGPGQQP